MANTNFDEFDWVDIPGFPGYQAIQEGFVRSNKQRKVILSPKMKKDGYEVIDLYKEDKTRCSFSVGRIIALTFLDNPSPDTLVCVVYLDGDKTNHAVSNLRWMSKKDAAVYKAPGKEDIPPNNSDPCICVKGNRTMEFQSKSEAIRFLGVSHSHFYDCINQKRECKGWEIITEKDLE